MVLTWLLLGCDCPWVQAKEKKDAEKKKKKEEEEQKKAEKKRKRDAGEEVSDDEGHKKPKGELMVPILSGETDEIVAEAHTFADELAKKTTKAHELGMKLKAMGCGSDSRQNMEILSRKLTKNYEGIKKLATDDCAVAAEYNWWMQDCLMPFKKLKKEIKIAQAIGNAATTKRSAKRTAAAKKDNSDGSD